MNLLTIFLISCSIICVASRTISRNHAADCDICASFGYLPDNAEYLCRVACFNTPNVPSYKLLRGINMTREEIDAYNPNSANKLTIFIPIVSVLIFTI